MTPTPRPDARTLRAMRQPPRPHRIRRTSQAIAIRYGLTRALAAARSARGIGPMPVPLLEGELELNGRLARAVDRWRHAYLAAYCRAWLRARRNIRKHPEQADPRIVPSLRRLLRPIGR